MAEVKGAEVLTAEQVQLLLDVAQSYNVAVEDGVVTITFESRAGRPRVTIDVCDGTLRYRLMPTIF